MPLVLVRVNIQMWMDISFEDISYTVYSRLSEIMVGRGYTDN
jgi:hypothetical protein